MGYILESESEADRLRLQERLDVYKVQLDLEGFELKSSDSILDAGCGVGLVSEQIYRRSRSNRILCCDFSELRLRQAKNYHHSIGLVNADYFSSNLSDIPLADNTFDKIVCRFVYEYLPDPQQVTNEFFRLLKPDGAVRVIDLDGVLVNLVTENDELNELLIELSSQLLEMGTLDVFAGRKIFQTFKKAGFKNIDVKIRPMSFTGQDLILEKQNYVERFKFADSLIVKVLGSARSKRFIQLYLDELSNEKSTIFYNNFIVTGLK